MHKCALVRTHAHAHSHSHSHARTHALPSRSLPLSPLSLSNSRPHSHTCIQARKRVHPSVMNHASSCGVLAVATAGGLRHPPPPPLHQLPALRRDVAMGLARIVQAQTTPGPSPLTPRKTPSLPPVLIPSCPVVSSLPHPISLLLSPRLSHSLSPCPSPSTSLSACPLNSIVYLSLLAYSRCTCSPSLCNSHHPSDHMSKHSLPRTLTHVPKQLAHFRTSSSSLSRHQGRSPSPASRAPMLQQQQQQQTRQGHDPVGAAAGNLLRG